MNAILHHGLGDSKLYMILKALDEDYSNNIEYATIRSHGEEWWSLSAHVKLSSAGPLAARRKADDRQTDRGFRIDQMGPRWQTNHLRIL